LSTSMAVTLMALVVMLFEGWKPIALREGLLLAGAAAFLALGYQFIIRSTRSGDISAVAPFRYVGLLMAVALGWAVWGFVPNAMAWAGIALLIGAVLVLLRQGARERVASLRPSRLQLREGACGPQPLPRWRATQPGTWSMRHCHQRGTLGVWARCT